MTNSFKPIFTITNRIAAELPTRLAEVRERRRLANQDFERLYPDINRRSLRRDLKAMVDVGLLVSEGATNKVVYQMKETG